MSPTIVSCMGVRGRKSSAAQNGGHGTVGDRGLEFMGDEAQHLHVAPVELSEILIGLPQLPLVQIKLEEHVAEGVSQLGDLVSRLSLVYLAVRALQRPCLWAVQFAALSGTSSRSQQGGAPRS